MNLEAIKLKQTIASRLTTMESVKFSMYAEKTDTTKSELIRTLIIEFLSKQSKKQIINN